MDEGMRVTKKLRIIKPAFRSKPFLDAFVSIRILYTFVDTYFYKGIKL